MSIQVEINKDSEGYPSVVEIRKGRRKLQVVFDSERGFQIIGKRSVLPSFNDILKLIYPSYQPKLAVALEGPIETIPLATGGKIILYDDMEGLLKWTQVDGTVSADNTVAYNGSQSLKVLCGAADTKAEAVRRFPVMNGSFKVNLYFACDDLTKLSNFRVLVTNKSQSTLYRTWIRGYASTKDWRYEGPTLLTVLTTLSELWEDRTRNLFHSFELRVENWRYQYLKIDNVKWEIKDGCSTVPLTGETYGEINLYVDNLVGQEVSMWFDDVKISEV